MTPSQMNPEWFDVRAPCASCYGEGHVLDVMGKHEVKCVTCNGEAEMSTGVIAHTFTHTIEESHAVFIILKGTFKKDGIMRYVGLLGYPTTATRCMHSYDCCGNYYNNTPRIRWVQSEEGCENNEALVTISWSQNI